MYDRELWLNFRIWSLLSSKLLTPCTLNLQQMTRVSIVILL